MSAIVNDREPISSTSRVHNPLIFFVNRGGILRTGFRTIILNAILVIHPEQAKIFPNVEVLLHDILTST
jgi:hypothetical protein